MILEREMIDYRKITHLGLNGEPSNSSCMRKNVGAKAHFVCYWLSFVLYERLVILTSIADHR